MRRWTAFAGGAAVLAALACGGSDITEPPVAVPAIPVPPEELRPPPPPAVLESGWMVILSGSADAAEAARLLAEYEAAGLPRTRGFPKVVDSATVEGLKPGFHVVVLAVPKGEAEATRMAEAWQTARPGAYAREVRVAHAEGLTCDGAGADPRCAPPVAGGWKVVVIFDFTDGMESTEWKAGTAEMTTKAGAAGIAVKWAEDYRVPVEVGGVRLDEVDVEPFAGELYGYVFAMQGKEPAYEPHGPTAWSSASYYFGVPHD